MKINRVAIPNILSCYRILAAGILVIFAIIDRPRIFIFLFALSLLTDIADGYLARKWNCESELGSKLDTWGDIATYLVLVIALFMLWPILLKKVYFYFIVGCIAFILPGFCSFIKFHKLPSYHTIITKFSILFLGSAILLMLIFDITRPIKYAVMLFAVASIESITVTLILPSWKCNISSFLEAIKIRNINRKHNNI
ncbi:MAG: CDP-alcohol phosphatidyltransferase family protein [Ignavibacteriaceae bacterium]